ncbi:MAG: hypothetical protein LBE12_18015 [Planctomycetaceae bacterium]|nr:hypothetical protein [Planctomycetaceae bacterium]
MIVKILITLDNSFGFRFFISPTTQEQDVPNRKCSTAQPTVRKPPILLSPAWNEIINHNNHHLALAGLWESGKFITNKHQTRDYLK